MRLYLTDACAIPQREFVCKLRLQAIEFRANGTKESSGKGLRHDSDWLRMTFSSHEHLNILCH